MSGSLTSSSEWLWIARKSAVTTLRPAARTCRQKSKSYLCSLPSDSSKRTLRTTHGEIAIRKPSIVSTSPVRAYGGRPFGSQEKLGSSPPPFSP